MDWHLTQIQFKYRVKTLSTWWSNNWFKCYGEVQILCLPLRKNPIHLKQQWWGMAFTSAFRWALLYGRLFLSASVESLADTVRGGVLSFVSPVVPGCVWLWLFGWALLHWAVQYTDPHTGAKTEWTWKSIYAIKLCVAALLKCICSFKK